MPLFKEVVIGFEFINKRLCVFTTNNIDYVGFDYGMCFFAHVEVITF